MADLGESLYWSLSGLVAGDTSPAEPESGADTYRGRKARMRALEQAVGGPEQAARAAGVTLRTWKRWAGKAARLTGTSVGKLQRAALPLYRAQHLRSILRKAPQPYICAVIAWNSYRVPWGSPPGYRCTKLDRLSGRSMVHLVRHWQAGNFPALAEGFQAVVQRVYGAPVIFEGDGVTLVWEGQIDDE